MSTISIFGRLTGDPECKTLQSGQLVTHFNLADNHGKDDQGKDKVSFFRVSAFGKAAEIIGNSCKKGHRLYVSGKFESRQYTNNSGQAATSLEVTLSEFQFGETKSDAAPAQQPSAAQPVQQYAPPPQGYPQQPQYQQQYPPQQAPPAARPPQNYQPPYPGQPQGYPPQQYPPQQQYAPPPQGYPQQSGMIPASDKPF